MVKIKGTNNEDIIALKWKDIIPDIVSPLRNTTQDYLKFINTREFSREALHFMEYGYYINAPQGTKDYDDYWDEQEKRCINGYDVGGVHISGRHYFMLNFGIMKAVPRDPKTGKAIGNRKILTFGRFLDHQYYLFNEIVRNFKEEHFAHDDTVDKQGLIIAKSRRKGITYFASEGIYAYNFTFMENSNSIMAAGETAHYKVLLDGTHDTLNFLNRYTDFGKARNVINKHDHFRASRKIVDEYGVESEIGMKSEIKAISFKDNPFKSIGDSVDFMGFEEAGKFNQLMTAYRIAEPTWRDGNNMTGVPILWGTGGDMEGGTKDFAEMFYDPKSYGLAAYNNIYDENSVGDCGYFIDDLWYYEGKVKKKTFINKKEVIEEIECVDDMGNSNREMALSLILAKRDNARKGNSAAYQKLCTQQPLTPAEAFMKVEGSPFPLMELSEQLAEIRVNPIYRNCETIGDLYYNTNGNVEFRENKNAPVIDVFPHRDLLDGAFIIYEFPNIDSNTGKVPNNRYIIGVDPIDFGRDETTSKDSAQSLGSCIIFNMLTERVVAEYSGKPRTANTFYDNCMKASLFYNALINVETNIRGMKAYFENKHKDYLLADEPTALRDTVVTSFKTTNKKGTRTTEQTNKYARTLINSWLLEEIDKDEKNGTTIMNLHKLRSKTIIQELIDWNSNGNFDRVSALGMVLILHEDRKKTDIKNVQQKKSISNDKFWSLLDGKKHIDHRLLGGFRTIL